MNESCLLRMSRLAMGTQFEVLLIGGDADYLRDAATQALDEVEAIEARLSHYLPDSEIGDLNARAATESVRVSPWMLGVLQQALVLAEATAGAFDPTLGALLACWGFHRGRGRMPSETEIEAALAQTGYQHLHLEADTRTVRFGKPGMLLNLGAFGKGLAIDRVVEVLRELRVEAALAHGGSSTLYVLGTPPDEDAWEIGLSDPDAPEVRLGTIRLTQQALSTSGDYRQFFEHDGRRYSHILDPFTGRPATGTRSATVITESAAASDALSTALFVRGETARLSVSLNSGEVASLLVSEDNEGERLPVRLAGGISFQPSISPSLPSLQS